MTVTLVSKIASQTSEGQLVNTALSLVGANTLADVDFIPMGAGKYEVVVRTT